jgi:6-phosphogluconate dehydrogenase
MKLGYVGLGKMGFNMVERLLEKGYATFVFDTNEGAVEKASRLGAQPARSLQSLVGVLGAPRLIWLMVPHEVIGMVVDTLVPFLDRGDTLVDGGNSFYKDSIKRAHTLESKGIDFLDVGVSGGPRGARDGACIMVGGKQTVSDRFETLFRDLSVEGGFAYMGRSGSGHFVKMVHNGIEYGMMQALAEGFALMKTSPFDLNLARVANLYNHRSVIESRLVGWLKEALERYGEDLKEISGTVSSTGEGGWTAEAAKELGASVPTIEEAVRFRVESQSNPSYTGQVLSALRNQFGSHDVFEKEKS